VEKRCARAEASSIRDNKKEKKSKQGEFSPGERLAERRKGGKTWVAKPTPEEKKEGKKRKNKIKKKKKKKKKKKERKEKKRKKRKKKTKKKKKQNKKKKEKKKTPTSTHSQ